MTLTSRVEGANKLNLIEMKPKIIKTDGTIIEVEPKNGKDFKLKELKDIVQGYIEIVSIGSHLNEKVEREPWCMIINEEGKLIGLSLNEKATELYINDIIVGDVLICPSSMIK